MQRYDDNLASRINGNGLQALSGVAVTVTDDATGLPAALYSDEGVTPILGPIITDDNGHFGFYAPNGEYTAHFASVRIAPFTRKIIQADPSDNPNATLAQLAAPSGAGLIGGSIAVATSIAALRALNSSRPSKHVLVTGYYASGDGGGGNYYLDASDTASADNGGTVIVATDGGRWKLKWAGYLTFRQFGAKGDYNLTTFSGTDDWAAAQKCINALLPTGGEAESGIGTFYTSAELLIDHAAGRETDDFTRVSLVGRGSGASQIVSNVPSGNAIRIKGYAGAGVHSYQHVRGIHLRALGGSFVGTAISMDNCSLGTFDDVVIENYEYGIKGTDVLSTHLQRCVFRGNAYGIQLDRSDFSHPNAISLNACVFSAQKYWAMIFNSPSSIVMTAGSMEGNGTDTGTPSRGGMKITNPGIEGAVGVAIDGTYCEWQGGIADFYSVSTGSGGAVAFSFVGVGLSRISSTQFVTNNIRIDSETKASVSVTGCGFKHLNDYAPNAARPYFSFSDPSLITFHEAGNMYASALEAPIRARTSLTVGASPWTYTNNSGNKQTLNVQPGVTVTSAVFVRNNFGDAVPVLGLIDLNPTDQVIFTYPGSAPTIIMYNR